MLAPVIFQVIVLDKEQQMLQFWWNFRTLHKLRAVNSIVAIVLGKFWRLSILTLVDIGTCHLLGQGFKRRTTNASILMKFCTLNKARVVNSIVTIVFCDSQRLSNLTRVNIGTCHLLGHSFGRRTASASILMKFCTLHKSRVVNSIVTIVFYDFRPLSNLTRVNIGVCHLLGHSFGPKTVNLPILMKFRTLHKSRGLNSMVTIVFCDSWRLSILAIVNIGTCYLLGHSFWPKTANTVVSFHVQQNCFRFVEQTLAKSCWLKLISHISVIKNEEIFIFFIIVFWPLHSQFLLKLLK